MKKNVILAGLLACMGITAQAQDAKTDEPKGKAIDKYSETSTPDSVSKMTTVDSNWNAVTWVTNTN